MEKNKKQRVLLILALCALLAVLALVGIRWGEPAVRLVSDPVAFREWVKGYGAWAPAFMVGLVALQILVAVIPGEPFEFAAGYAFGAWQGMLWCMLGSAVGGALAMLLVRRFGVKLINTLFPRQNLQELAIFKKPERLKMLTFLLFLIPGTPKDLMIYALGLTPMGIVEAVGLTCLARIPSILTSTLSGHALGQEQYAAAAVIYGFTGLASLIIILIYRRHVRREKEAEQARDGGVQGK